MAFSGPPEHHSFRMFQFAVDGQQFNWVARVTALCPQCGKEMGLASTDSSTDAILVRDVCKNPYKFPGKTVKALETKLSRHLRRRRDLPDDQLATGLTTLGAAPYCVRPWAGATVSTLRASVGRCQVSTPLVGNRSCVPAVPSRTIELSDD